MLAPILDDARGAHGERVSGRGQASECENRLRKATGKGNERENEDENGWRATTEGIVLRSTQASKGGTRDLYF